MLTLTFPESFRFSFVGAFCNLLPGRPNEKQKHCHHYFIDKVKIVHVTTNSSLAIATTTPYNYLDNQHVTLLSSFIYYQFCGFVDVPFKSQHRNCIGKLFLLYLLHKFRISFYSV